MKINFRESISKLKNGETVAVPTDTVYGLACDLKNEEAILKLYNLKKRDNQKPMVIQLGSSSEVKDYLSLIPYDLEKLTHRFWPGPLTLVLPINESKVPSIARSHLPTAAFRVTQNIYTKKLASELGPIVVTSANLSGQLELKNIEELERHFGEDFPIFVPDEFLPFSGTPSTVLGYIDASWVILRKGEVGFKELRHVLGYNPPFARHFDYKKGDYIIEPQFYMMEKDYDASIEVVVGFEDRKYPGAKEVITLGTLNKPLDCKEAILKIMNAIKENNYPYVWFDLNFPKEGSLKELCHILKRSELSIK